LVWARVQTFGDFAFGHHAAWFEGVIQTFGGSAFGHHALALELCRVRSAV
jgi:hypothetical protein